MAMPHSRHERARRAALGCVLLALFPAAAHAAGVLRVVEENDFFAAQGDRFYTQGLQLSYEHFGDSPSEWPLGPRSTTRWLVAQSMYTPSDITVDTLLTHDRPYGGWLHVGHEWRRREETRLRTVRMDIGVLGPHAFAAEVQTAVHQRIGADLPQGWHLQLPDRLALTALYRVDRSVAETRLVRVPLRLLLGGGATVGNVFDHVQSSITLTFGSLLDPLGELEPSPPSLTPSAREPTGLGATLLLRSDIRYVMYNAFLDPRPPAAPLAISTLPWVLDLEAGIHVRFGAVQLQYLLVRRSSEFRPGDGGHIYGSLNLVIGM
jgi:hypothetical protein